MIYLLTVGDREVRADVQSAGPGLYRITIDGETFGLSARRSESSIYSVVLGTLDGSGNVEPGGKAFEADVEIGADRVGVAIEGEYFDIGAIDERRKKLRAAASGGAAAGNELHSPMPGKVVKILARPGTAVKKGQGVVVVEAMKMENELAAPKDGTVKSVAVSEGQPVEGGALLLVIE